MKPYYKTSSKINVCETIVRFNRTVNISGSIAVSGSITLGVRGVTGYQPEKYNKYNQIYR